MYSGPQPGVANQLVRSVKPRDVADGRQQLHRTVNTNPWQLHQERGLVPCSIRFRATLGWAGLMSLRPHRMTPDRQWPLSR